MPTGEPRISCSCCHFAILATLGSTRSVRKVSKRVSKFFSQRSRSLEWEQQVTWNEAKIAYYGMETQSSFLHDINSLVIFMQSSWIYQILPLFWCMDSACIWALITLSTSHIKGICWQETPCVFASTHSVKCTNRVWQLLALYSCALGRC